MAYKKGNVEYYSEQSARKQIPKGLKTLMEKGIIKKNTLVFNNGAGKYWEEADKFLKDLKAKCVHHDPEAFSKEFNKAQRILIRERGKADVGLLLKVLNIIHDKKTRQQAIRQTARYTKKGGQLYITVWDGGKSKPGCRGKGKNTTWQNCKPITYYEKEIREALPKSATMKRLRNGYLVQL